MTCPPGQYCLGGAIPPIDCQRGYYCSIGSEYIAPGLDVEDLDLTAEELDLVETMGGICPIDHYCPEGTSQPLMCREG